MHWLLRLLLWDDSVPVPPPPPPAVLPAFVPKFPLNPVLGDSVLASCPLDTAPPLGPDAVVPNGTPLHVTGGTGTRTPKGRGPITPPLPRR